MAQERYATVIFGCGNQLMGDDGFGPAVIDHLDSISTLPDAVAAVDAGTNVREYLFDYLLAGDGLPRHVVVVDAVDIPGRRPGEVFTIATSDIPPLKIHDFSLHQFPTVNLLSELERHVGMRVTILVAQVEHIPGEIAPGLSKAMQDAIPVACDKLLQILSDETVKRGPA